MPTLEEAFEFQKALENHLYGVTLPKKDLELASRYALGIYSELGEALAADKSWKDWRVQKNNLSYSDLKEEIADVWIFLINYTMANGLDCFAILNEIENKQNKLKKRHGVEV